MSNASALIIEFIVRKAEIQTEAGNKTSEDNNASVEMQTEQTIDQTIEQTTTAEAGDPTTDVSDSRRDEEAALRQEKRRRLGKRVVESVVAESGKTSERSIRGEQSSSRTTARAADAVVSEAVRLWERGCVVCRAQGRRSRLEHAWESCRLDPDVTADVKKGVGFLSEVRAPFRRQGFRCWARGEGCRCMAEGRQGGCSGSEVVRLAVAALLFAGKTEVREWVEQQEAFVKSIEQGEEGRVGLEELLSKRRIYEGEQQAGLDRFLALWAR
jgi:hypothetical protein